MHESVRQPVRRGKVRRLLSDRVYAACCNAFLALVTVLILFPVLNIVATSFSSYGASITGRVWIWPVEVQLQTYKAVFSSRNIWIGYRNTVLYAVAGTAVNLVVTIMAAYPLSFPDLKGKNAVAAVFAFTMLFSGGMIPSYIVVNRLGLIDTLGAMILPGALSVWNMVILRTFFQSSIPYELYEAATMDGCGELTYLFHCVLPLSGSILAVIGLYYAVGHWNSFFNALLYLNTKNRYPLQIFLREMLIVGSMEAEMVGSMDHELYAQGASELIKYAVIVISSAPMLAVYVFIQKFFVRGVMIGAIKG